MYGNNNNRGFTFVELIVVITILVILSTIGFGVYQSYLSGGRDVNRLVQLKDIHSGLERHSIDTRLPFPENMVEIQAIGDTFAYQGYAGENVIKTIGYDGGGKDIEFGGYLTYMLAKNGKDFQLMTYIGDSKLLGNSLVDTSYANQDYTIMFPKVLGTPLGILVDQVENIPIQDISVISSAGKYDIVNESRELISYLSDTSRIILKQGDDITLMLPQKSCKRIKELGKSQGSGEYVINPTGGSQKIVYCDMETDDGGWTFIGHIDGTTPVSQVSFSGGLGDYSVTMQDKGETYFIDSMNLVHKEMMALINTNNPNRANENNSLLLLKYGLDAEMFHTNNLMACSDKFGKSDGYFYKTFLDSEYIYSNIGDCGPSGWWLRPSPYQPGGLYLLRMRDTGGATFGTEWRPEAWTHNPLDTSKGFGHDVWLFVR